MSNAGWVCSYRAIWEHQLFAGDAERVGVWDWMIKKAAWKPMRFKAGGEVITLDRGQLCVSQAQICEETGISRKRLRAFLEDLQGENAVGIKPANGRAKGRSLITIRKYGKYQDKPDALGQEQGQERAKEGPTKEQGNNSTSSVSKETGEQVAVSQPVPFDLRKVVFDTVVPALVRAGHDEKSARGLVARWFKGGNSDADVLNAYAEAQKAGAVEPFTYMQAILSNPATEGGAASRAMEIIRERRRQQQ